MNPPFVVTERIYCDFPKRCKCKPTAVVHNINDPNDLQNFIDTQYADVALCRKTSMKKLRAFEIYGSK